MPMPTHHYCVKCGNFALLNPTGWCDACMTAWYASFDPTGAQGQEYARMTILWEVRP